MIIFFIVTSTLDGGIIDEGTSSWSVPNAAPISGAKWELAGSQTQVSALGEHRVYFSLSFPVEANSTAEFIFPNDISISEDLKSYVGLNLFKSGINFITKSSNTVHVN